MVAPPVPLKVSGKVKVLVGIPKLPSFAQSLLEVLELDDEVLKAELLLLDNEVLDDEVLNAELLLLDNEELKKELLLLDDEVLEDELLLLDDELLNEELLLLDNEVLDGEALKAELLLLEDELLTLGDELLEDVFATALDANTLRADDATLVKTELLERVNASGLEDTLDAITEAAAELAIDVGTLTVLDANDAVLSTEDTLLSEVAIGGVKTELPPPPPPPPPHAVNKHINVASMSRVIASFFNIIDLPICFIVRCTVIRLSLHCRLIEPQQASAAS